MRSNTVENYANYDIDDMIFDEYDGQVSDR